MVTTTVVQDGDEVAIIIPPEIMEALGIAVGTTVEVELQLVDGDNRLVLRPLFTPGARCVVEDRYSGIYSGGKFIAWPLDARSIPAKSQGNDVEAAAFWTPEHLCGKGDSADAALKDLERQLTSRAEEVLLATDGVALGGMIDQMNMSTASAEAAVDDALDKIDASNQRIEVIEHGSKE